MDIAGNRFDKSLYFIHGNDGTLSLHIVPVVSSVVTGSFYSLHGANGLMYKGKHTKGLTQRVAEARDKVGLMLDKYRELEHKCRMLTQHPKTTTALLDMLDVLGMTDKSGAPEASLIKKATLRTQLLERINQYEIRHPETAGSLWELFQGACEFIDFDWNPSSKGEDRVRSLLLQAGADKKAAAFAVCSNAIAA